MRSVFDPKRNLRFRGLQVIEAREGGLNRLNVARRAAACLVAMGCLWIAGRSVYNAALGVQTIALTAFVVVVLVTFAAGLFVMNLIARRIAAALSLFAAVLFPVGYINPFAAMDMEAAGHAPPTVMSILLWMGPVVAGLLVLAWLLDPPRTKSVTTVKH
jgi:hypothetical protein